MPQLTNYILSNAQNSRFKQPKKKPNKITWHKLAWAKYKPKKSEKTQFNARINGQKLLVIM